jgi:hypothetical protein
MGEDKGGGEKIKGNSRNYSGYMQSMQRTRVRRISSSKTNSALSFWTYSSP